MRKENLHFIQRKEPSGTGVPSKTESKESVIKCCGRLGFSFWFSTLLEVFFSGEIIDNVSNVVRISKSKGVEATRLGIDALIVVERLHGHRDHRSLWNVNIGDRKSNTLRVHNLELSVNQF